MVLTQDAEFAFESGHVATASGNIYYCHCDRGICVVEHIWLNQPYIVQIYLKPILHKTLRVDNFRRLDFAEFTRIGFNVEFAFHEPELAPADKQVSWSAASINGEEIQMAVESLEEMPVYSSQNVSAEFLISGIPEEIDEDNDDPTYDPVNDTLKKEKKTFRPGASALKSKHLNRSIGVESGSFVCSCCPRSFPTQQKLSAHRKKHVVEKTNHCQLCDKAFSWKCDLNKHYMTGHSMAERQILGEDPRLPFVCEIRGFRAARESHLWLHQRVKRHGTPRPPQPRPSPRSLRCRVSKPSTVSQDPVCEVCGHIFLSKRALNKHRKEQHPSSKITKFQCEECEFSTDFRDKFREHMLYTHKSVQSVRCLGLSNSPYQCIPCSQWFKTYQRIEQHLRTEHSGQYVTCKWWGETVHRKMTGHQCPECELVLANKYKLQTHMRQHTDERPYSCEHCSRRFRYPQDKLKHMIVHLDKTFECQECGRKFRTEKSLRSHIVVMHRKESAQRPLRHCEQCGDMVPVANFKYHTIRAHTDPSEWPYKCSLCDYRAVVAASVKEHMISKHTHQWPFRCEICHFGCLHEPDFTKHMSQHDQGKPMPLRDEHGQLLLANNVTQANDSTAVSLIDAAISSEEQESSGSMDPFPVRHYSAELIRDALESYYHKSMKITEIVDLYGISRYTFYDCRRKYTQLRSDHPDWSDEEIYAAIEPPQRPMKVAEKYPQELMDAALNDISQGTLTTAEAATLYGMPRSTLVTARKRQQITDVKRQKQLDKTPAKMRRITTMTREHFQEALGAFNSGKMKVMEVVREYGVPRQTLYDYRNKLNELRKEHPDWSEEELYDNIPLPEIRKKGSNEDSFPKEVIDEALADISKGKLTAKEAAEIYEVPCRTLIGLLKKRGLQAPKGKRGRKRAIPLRTPGIKVFKVEPKAEEEKFKPPHLVPIIKRLFQCKKCGRKFGEFSQLKQHQISHLVMLFGCNKCNFKAKTKLELDDHARTHDAAALDAIDILQQFVNID